jgi:hypothetical protein
MTQWYFHLLQEHKIEAMEMLPDCGWTNRVGQVMLKENGFLSDERIALLNSFRRVGSASGPCLMFGFQHHIGPVADL